MAFSPVDDTLAFGGDDGWLTAVSCTPPGGREGGRECKLLWTLCCHGRENDACECVFYDSDGEEIHEVGQSTIYENNAECPAHGQHGPMCRALCFSSDGRTLIPSSEDDVVCARVLDVRTGALLTFLDPRKESSPGCVCALSLRDPFPYSRQ